MNTFRSNRVLKVLSVVACLMSGGRSARAVDAAAVFRSAGPGVVLIRDIEGFGSGVVLSPDGLILTCYHVVNTPLQQTVVADVLRAGQRSKMEFSDASIVGVHPKYDLALIRVKAPAGTTFSVPMKSTRPKLDTGEECFVIGNPGGASGKVLDNSISKGIVSSAERELDGLSYIQVTAQINPGNSGGAVCDKNGHVAGIVTFKIDQAEGLGFAIPMAGLKMADFIKPEERKGDLEKYKEYEEAGTRLLELARASEGERKDVATRLAYICFRLSLAELPNDSAPYHNVGLMYYDDGEFDTAEVFLKKAIELKPDSPASHHLLGMINTKRGKTEASNEHFLAGATSKRVEPMARNAQAACAENYAVSLSEQQRHAECAYMVQWAQHLNRDPARQANRQLIFQQSTQQLSDAQFAEIREKTDGFSVEDMKRFAAGKTTASATPPSASAQPSAQPGKQPGAPTQTAAPASRASPTAAKLFEKLLEGAPKPEAGGIRKALPDTPIDIRPALGGAYLAMLFPEMGKLGLFNIAHAKFDLFIPVPRDAIYAAGGAVLVIFLPQERVFQLWDVNSLQRVGSKPSRIIGVLTDMEMAPLNPKHAIISYADNTDALSQRHYAILDLSTFQFAEITDSTFVRNRSYRDNIQMRFDDHFGALAMWCTSHSPSGVLFARVSPAGVSSAVYDHKDMGSLSVDGSGRRLYTGRGRVLLPNGETIATYEGASLFKVTGGDLFLEVRKNQATVRESIGNSEIKVITLPFTFAPTSWQKNKLTDDRLIHGSAPLNRVCFIDIKGLAVHVFELGLGEDAAQVRQLLEGVSAGKVWTRKMGYPTGTRVNVEDAPPGVKYDPASGSLSWSVPANQPSGSVTILLSVTLPGKDESYQRVVVPVR